MQSCECRGMAGSGGTTCWRPRTRPAVVLARCESYLCATCAKAIRCCACGAPAEGHFRALEVLA